MGRDPREPEPHRGRSKPPGASSDVDADRERLYARVSEEIGAGSIPRNRDGRGGAQGARPVTTGKVLAAAILSVSTVLIGIGLLPFIYALFVPVPFSYQNSPFPICRTGTTSIDDCLPDGDEHPFHPGDVVPFIVTRCADDVFARSTQLPYVLSRNLVNDESGTRVILPSLSTAATSGGCETVITFAHQLPDAIAPGRYYLEGVATVYGRFRTVNAYFQTQPFVVERSKE